MKFEALNLDPKLFNAITELGYEKCTPVQEQSLPESLLGNDIAVQAQTGTGKTAVFLVTALQRMIMENDQGGVLRVLVLVPTRELAVQVEDQAVSLCKHLHYRSIAVYGGVGYDEQERALSGGAEIIVATPGRLIDFIKNRKVNLGTLKFFIIDEVDRMFDMGFMEDVKYILKFAPPKEKRQTIIVSATLDDRIRHLAYQHMNNPTEIEIEPDQITVDLVEQKLFHVSREEKFPLLLTLLRQEQFRRVIVFTNMKRTAEELGHRLAANKMAAEVLTGDIDQKKRLKIIERMKEGVLGVLIATDVAARGLHIDDVSHVINYDLPADAANYVHRIGRTARAGATGVAYTLACEDLVVNLPPIERYIGQKIEVSQIDFEIAKDEAGPYRRARRREGSGPPARGQRPPVHRKSGPSFGSSQPSDGGRGARPSAPSGGGKRFSKPFEKGRGEKGRGEHRPEARRAMPKPSQQMSHEDRMDIYRKKYGDSFGKAAPSDGGAAKKHQDGPKKSASHGHKHEHRPTHHSPKSAHKPAHAKAAVAVAPKKKGLLGKIFGVFKKKKA